MSFPGRFEPRGVRRTLAALVSGALHVGLFLVIILSGGRQDGTGRTETSLTQFVLLEAEQADHREGVELTPIEPSLARPEIAEQLQARSSPPASFTIDDGEPDSNPAPITPLDEPTLTEAVATTAIHEAASFVMSHAEQSALSQRLAQLAERLAKEQQTEVAWEQDGKQYSAVLIQERANDGTALDRIIARVSAADHGKQLSTRVLLKRLAFSQFTQIVDRWDPMVQLHDDVIVGRFHTNSSFNVLYGAGAKPEFLGRVTTTARSFDMQATGRGSESSIFRGGIETRADRIPLPEELRPSKWAPPDSDARVHAVTGDTRIRFFADGSYTWRTEGAATPEYLNAPSEHPVYFIATTSSTLYVRGTVAGKILVYSPQKIVVEGNLTYAHDPRRVADSRDYLGLVCDKYVEVAPPGVTGPGDLEIHAAIFAGRRFVVRDIDYHRSATLRIYGSLAAGSLSASEPRYATKIEYDGRFEQRRPPGFPSTNRYEVEDWDGRWSEAPERSADGAF